MTHEQKLARAKVYLQDRQLMPCYWNKKLCASVMQVLITRVVARRLGQK